MRRIIIANTNSCRIYDYQKSHNSLSLIKEINHPENKLKNQDLVSDGPGHYKSGTTGRGAFSPRTEPTDVNFDNFAREMAVGLDEERNKNDFKELVVIMPAQMEGLFLHHLNKHVNALITKRMQKNIMHLSEHELLSYFNENL